MAGRKRSTPKADPDYERKASEDDHVKIGNLLFAIAENEGDYEVIEHRDYWAVYFPPKTQYWTLIVRKEAE